jgi:hypothetical protein
LGSLYVPTQPTRDEIAAAVALIREGISDFPFVSELESANAIALMLLPFARELIEGPTPLHLIEKPSPGTGASLLAEVLAYPSTGQSLAIFTEARNEDEWRKRLTAKLMTSPTFILKDNSRGLDSSQLSAALTASVWEDRVLGQSEMVKIPIRCVWIVTGNNPAVSAEIARRTIRIRLDAKVDRPWLRERGGFKHPDLSQWFKEHRTELVSACLTLIQAWLNAGRPPGAIQLGMFEPWARTMGGILNIAGVDGFLSNLSDFYEQSDTEGASWRPFIAAWLSEFGTNRVGVAQLFGLLEGHSIDIELGNGDVGSKKISLGKKLTHIRDRVFDGYVVTAVVKLNRAQQWQLIKTEA